MSCWLPSPQSQLRAADYSLTAWNGFDDKVLSLYAHGMRCARFRRISPKLISSVTDAVIYQALGLNLSDGKGRFGFWIAQTEELCSKKIEVAIFEFLTADLEQ